jgi:hypothetical protein
VNAPLLLILSCLAPSQLPEGFGVIAGVAVNGTHGQTPLANAAVVLRANQDGAFVPVAETTTDADGRFTFTGLSIAEGLIYLPGVNRDEVHYPGPRVRFTRDRPAARVRIIAYDAAESPSPLVCRRHDIDVRTGEGYVEITETLLIANPGLTAYVGEKPDDRPPVTLRLSLPQRLDKVTFEKEFDGRNFLLHNSDLITDLPWPPGEREVRFRYRLPAERRDILVKRTLDLPTEHFTLRVWSDDPNHVVCNLPIAPEQADGTRLFEHSGALLPAGHDIELRLGALPIPVETYARWGAAGLLGLLIMGFLIKWRRRKQVSIAESNGVRPAHVPPPNAVAKQHRRRRRTTSSGPNR